MLWKISRSLQKGIFPSKKNVFIRRENIGRIQAWREKSKNDSLLLISSNHDPSCCRNFDRRGDDEPWFEAGRREKTPCNRTSAIKSDFIPSNRNRSSLDSFWSLRATPLRGSLVSPPLVESIRRCAREWSRGDDRSTRSFERKEERKKLIFECYSQTRRISSIFGKYWITASVHHSVRDKINLLTAVGVTRLYRPDFIRLMAKINVKY